MKGWIVDSSVVRHELQFLAYKHPEMRDEIESTISRIMEKEEFNHVPTEECRESRMDIIARRVRRPDPFVGSHFTPIFHKGSI